MWSPALLERERPRVRQPEPAPQQRREHALLALQRGAGNQAVSMLLRDKTKKGGATAPAGLTEEEKKDKVRILTDYVRFTPPAEFVDQYGKNPPKTSKDYLAKLLEKIRGGKHVQESLKSKKNMQALAEDDDWADGTYNATTLKKVVDDTWGKPDTSRIGKKWDPFDKHDCVFAAITHVMGYGDKNKSDIAVEKAVADAFNHAYGEVEDSILYRMMERLGWAFEGRFEKWADFVARAGTDTFIVSENKDSGGTSGHVIVAEPDTAIQISGNGTKTKIYDRQSQRFGSGRQDPTFAVYAWKVDLSSKLASEIVANLANVK